MTTSQLNHLNNRLGRVLGRTPTGQPLMRWSWSESLTHPMRDVGYDFAPTDGGLVVARPKFVVRKMNPALQDQWVICRWEAPIPESEWREAFGYSMEWPREGEYYPTNMALPAHVDPTDEWTDRVIQAESERRSKSLADHAAQIERELDMRERHARGERAAIIDDACTAFGNVPGQKRHVSFPTAAPSR